jgi:hypothetical protein
LAATGMNASAVQLAAAFVPSPISFLVIAGMLTALLPTSFGRGLPVALIYAAIGIAILIVVSLVAFLVALGLGISFGGRQADAPAAQKNTRKQRVPGGQRTSATSGAIGSLAPAVSK